MMPALYMYIPSTLQVRQIFHPWATGPRFSIFVFQNNYNYPIYIINKQLMVSNIVNIFCSPTLEHVYVTFLRRVV